MNLVVWPIQLYLSVSIVRQVKSVERVSSVQLYRHDTTRTPRTPRGSACSASKVPIPSYPGIHPGHIQIWLDRTSPLERTRYVFASRYGEFTKGTLVHTRVSNTQICLYTRYNRYNSYLGVDRFIRCIVFLRCPLRVFIRCSHVVSELKLSFFL